MREIHSLAEFDARIAGHGNLDGTVIQGIDLRDRTDSIISVTCAGTTFLGAAMTDAALRHVHEAGAIVFPRFRDLPFDPYRPCLYRRRELLQGWIPGDVTGRHTFEQALDTRIYRWAAQYPRGSHLPVVHALARRLHDHAIDDALRDHLDTQPRVVAIMGGHGLTRAEASYRTVAELGWSLARGGYHVATGGGPGAMEAANLGAWLSPRPETAIDEAVGRLSVAVDFADTDPYLSAGLEVCDAFDDGGESLAVPTWFYGHEPTNQFATLVAKYFANSIREDGLLAIANHGVVFAPGSAGTVQEIFQDATQNHYGVFGVVSPMVLLGRRYWGDTLPAECLLRDLAVGRDYSDMITTVDTADEAVRWIADHPPKPVDL